MEVTLSEEATRYVAEHGGTLYVRTHSHRCCQGPLTLVDVTTSPPRDLADYVAYDAGAVAVQFHGGIGYMAEHWASRFYRDTRLEHSNLAGG